MNESVQHIFCWDEIQAAVGGKEVETIEMNEEEKKGAANVFIHSGFIGPFSFNFLLVKCRGRCVERVTSPLRRLE